MSAYGSITALSGGTATLNASQGQQSWWIQNNDTALMTATFKDSGANVLGQFVLAVAPGAGQAGGLITSHDFPVFLDVAAGGSVVLTGGATAPFSSGASTRLPRSTAIVTPGAVRSI